MLSPSSRVILLCAATVLAGCATPPAPSGPAGKHLVYRDGNGVPIRQFDYPTDDFCKRVEAAAGRSARCLAESVAGKLQAKATLRYNPPGVLVQSHYIDMSQCQRDNSRMSAGVELVNACAPK